MLMGEKKEFLFNGNFETIERNNIRMILFLLKNVLNIKIKMKGVKKKILFYYFINYFVI